MDDLSFINWLQAKRWWRPEPKRQSPSQIVGLSTKLSNSGDDGLEMDHKSFFGSSGAVPLLLDSQGRNPMKRLSSSISMEKVASTKSMHGWRFWSKACALMSGIVLLVNLILTIWAVKSFPISDGIGTFQHGSCKRTRTLSLWLHLAINILSTLLLGASNYCMQCLSSPTRREIDVAHQQRRQSLDIGVPNLTNLKSISRSRMVIWCILGLSSIPLHFWYNSAIFSEISTIDYTVYTVAQNFVDGAPFDPTGHNLTDFDRADRLEILQNSTHMLSNLTNEECMKTYFKDFVSSHGDVLAVSSTVNKTDSLLAIPFKAVPNINNDEHQLPPMAFICEDPIFFADGSSFYQETHACTLDASLPDAQNWKVSNYTIDYCLSQPVQEECKLQFSLVIMLIVIGCNATKCICMVYLAIGSKEEPLVTLGDSISSFLNRPDLTTKGFCLAGRDSFQTTDWEARALTYNPKKRRWFRAATAQRWIITTAILLLYIVAGGIILKYALHWTSRGTITIQSLSIKALWRLGFGAVAANSLLNWNIAGGRALIFMAFVANTPQLLLSFVYISYNGLFTCMLRSQEWSRFARHRKTLRVSAPEGQQRSTYRLQLPLSYGVPLLILSGFIHWVVSQCIFLVRIATYSTVTGKLVPQLSKYSCGYSCIAIITAIFVGSLMLLALLANGFRRYEAGMPFVASSSLAISAACHPLAGTEEGSQLLPLKWGAVGTNEGEVGHCSFSAEGVNRPTRGMLYAGK